MRSLSLADELLPGYPSASVPFVSMVETFDAHIGLVGQFGLRATNVSVVDTCFLFDRAAERILGGAPARSLGMAGVGSTRWFAPMQVLHELRNTLVTAATSRQVEPAAVALVLEDELLPAVRFVALPEDESRGDERVLDVQRRDIDDVDCARLSVFLAPCQVLSRDRDLRRPGLAPPDDAALRVVIAAGVELNEGDGLQVGGLVVMRASGACVSAGARGIAVRLDVPMWSVAVVAAALGACTAAWIVASPERRRRFGEVALHGLEIVNDVVERRDGARKALQLASIEQRGSTLASHLARALALADRPLLAWELYEELTRAERERPPSVDDIRAVLRQHSAFVPSEQYGWQLGRRLSLADAPAS